MAKAALILPFKLSLAILSMSIQSYETSVQTEFEPNWKDVTYQMPSGALTRVQIRDQTCNTHL